jgi:hypothetical protein
MSSETFPPLAAAYYEVSKDAGLSPGRICWAPITYVEKEYQVAEVAQTSPSDDSATVYRVVRYTEDHHISPPVFGPNLRATEAMRVGRMKRRPAIILSSRVDPWTDKGDVKRHSTKSRLLVPLYTIERYSPAWIGRVQCFEYNSHFYLPANPLPGGKPNRAVFARFEQAQTVDENLIEPCGFCLDADVLDYLHSWFEYFVRGTHNEASNLLAQVYEPVGDSTSSESSVVEG